MVQISASQHRSYEDVEKFDQNTLLSFLAFGQKRIVSERQYQEKQNGANLDSVAPSSEEFMSAESNLMETMYGLRPETEVNSPRHKNPCMHLNCRGGLTGRGRPWDSSDVHSDCRSGLRNLQIGLQTQGPHFSGLVKVEPTLFRVVHMYVVCLSCFWPLLTKTCRLCGSTDARKSSPASAHSSSVSTISILQYYYV